jgi:hypothetical protein
VRRFLSAARTLDATWRPQCNQWFSTHWFDTVDNLAHLNDRNGAITPAAASRRTAQPPTVP